MGNSRSTNIANITTNIISEEVSNELSQIDLKGGQSQMISVSGGTGDVNIYDNVQRMQMTVDMTAIAKQMSTQRSQQSIVQKLSQAAASSTSGLNLFNNSRSDNVMNNFLNASMKVSSNLAQICTASSNQSQVISVDQRDGKVDIHGNVQEEMASVIGKCIQEAQATNESLQQASQELSQTASAETKGLNLMDLIILALVGLLMMAAPVLIPVVAGVSGGVTVVTALMGPILLACGIVSIWWWTKHRTDQKKTMTGTQFSTLISQDPTCGAKAFIPEGVNSPSAASSGNPLNDAGAICLNDEKCKAFDWDASVNPPKITYYTSVSSVPCKNVNVQDLQKAGIDLVASASFHQGWFDPDKTKPEGSKAGDVFLNTFSGRWFWKIQPGSSTQNPWVDITDGQTFPGWPVGDKPEGFSVVAGQMTTPQDSMGKDGDLYINTTDPNGWELWKRYDGKYKPLDSKEAGKMIVGPNGGTLLSIPYAKTNNMSFPGRHGVTKPAQNYNWSAYVVTEDKSSYFWLILGIFLCFGGVAIICLKLYQWYQSKSATKGGSPSTTKTTPINIEMAKN